MWDSIISYMPAATMIAFVVYFTIKVLKSTKEHTQAIKQMKNPDPHPKHNDFIRVLASAIECEQNHNIRAVKVLQKYTLAAEAKLNQYCPQTHFTETLYWTLMSDKLTTAVMVLSMIEDVNGDFEAEELFERYSLKKEGLDCE